MRPVNERTDLRRVEDAGSAVAGVLGMAFQVVFSADGSQRHFTFVGQPCEALNGVTAEAAMADPFVLYDLILPEHREAFMRAEAEALAKLQAFDMEVPMRLPGGEVRWRRICSAPRLMADGSTVWDGLEIDVTERRVIAEQLAEQRRAAEENRDLMLGELAHRAKNGIAVVMSIVKQSARTVSTVAEFEAVLTARLQAMADSQDLVTDAGGKPVLLAEVVRRGLAPFGLPRFDLDPALGGVMVGGDIAVGMALLLHEMGTNAVKYGSLSNGRGRVAVALPEAGVLTWRETAGPPVTQPDRQGFGTRLLEAALRNRGGKVEFAFEPDGFQARTKFPTAE
ncbi:MAG: HWE histidine kinase domain-containing protein [Phenylobacterium sp.]